MYMSTFSYTVSFSLTVSATTINEIMQICLKIPGDFVVGNEISDKLNLHNISIDFFRWILMGSER